jgi:hypothetical protein
MSAGCYTDICICEIFSNHTEIYIFTDRVRRNMLFLQIPIIKDWNNEALDRNQCGIVANLFRDRKVLQERKGTSYNLPENVAGIIQIYISMWHGINMKVALFQEDANNAHKWACKENMLFV